MPCDSVDEVMAADWPTSSLCVHTCEPVLSAHFDRCYHVQEDQYNTQHPLNIDDDMLKDATRLLMPRPREVATDTSFIPVLTEVARVTKSIVDAMNRNETVRDDSPVRCGTMTTDEIDSVVKSSRTRKRWTSTSDSETSSIHYRHSTSSTAYRSIRRLSNRCIGRNPFWHTNAWSFSSSYITACSSCTGCT